MIFFKKHRHYFKHIGFEWHYKKEIMTGMTQNLRCRCGEEKYKEYSAEVGQLLVDKLNEKFLKVIPIQPKNFTQRTGTTATANQKTINL